MFHSGGLSHSLDPGCYKSMIAWGVEPSAPFLDREFFEVATGLDVGGVMAGARRIEKSVAARGIRRLSAGLNTVAPKGTVQLTVPGGKSSACSSPLHQGESLCQRSMRI